MFCQNIKTINTILATAAMLSILISSNKTICSDRAPTDQELIDAQNTETPTIEIPASPIVTIEKNDAEQLPLIQPMLSPEERIAMEYPLMSKSMLSLRNFRLDHPIPGEQCTYDSSGRIIGYRIIFNSDLAKNLHLD